MRLFVTFLGNVLFHLVFGTAFIAGACGLAALINFWPKREPDEGNLLVAVGILSVAVAAAGALGILKFRDKATRTLDVNTDLAPLRPIKPLSNVLIGLAILLVGAASFSFQFRRATPGNDLIEIPIVVLAGGVLQFGFGVYQLIFGRGPGKLGNNSAL